MLAFIVRGISPMTNRPEEDEKKWMENFDFACMIFFSITDSITAFGITYMFY
jgi:hypothetical protein